MFQELTLRKFTSISLLSSLVLNQEKLYIVLKFPSLSTSLVLMLTMHNCIIGNICHLWDTRLFLPVFTLHDSDDKLNFLAPKSSRVSGWARVDAGQSPGCLRPLPVESWGAQPAGESGGGTWASRGLVRSHTTMMEVGANDGVQNM